MDLRRRLIAPSFHDLHNGRKIFDTDSLIKRLMLFETYIIDSIKLTEIPYLVRIFGVEGLLAIFESGALKLNCAPKHTGSLSPNLFIDAAPQDKIRPPFHYSLATAEIIELYHHINLSLREIEPQMELSSRQIIRLRRAIYSALESPQDVNSSFSLESTKVELLSSPDLLASAVAISVKKYLHNDVKPLDIDISIQYESENDFKVDSNIQRLLDIDQLTAHKIIESACLAIAHCNDRIEQMREYSALSGFTDVDLPIFGKKLDFLASALSIETDQHRFQRVIKLSGLPQIEDNHNIRIDAKQLLAIRHSNECMEFRQWLSTTDALSDDEIIRQIRSLSKTIGRLIGGKPGQNIRFLITNGVGFIPVVGQIASIPLSILDHFLLEKIFPRSGISAFVDDMYPSIFENR